MLSLPLITPRDDSALWPSLSHRLNPFDNPSATTDPQNPNNPNPHPHNLTRRPHSRSHQHSNPSRSFFASLTADENTIQQRKQNVRRFGAGWIRPPGVAKTYQATMDELAEREEQEILARREQALLDLASAQEEAAAREAAERGEDDGDEGDGEGERDLDDEVPEAEEEGSEGSEDADGDQGSEEGEGEGEMTFNEDSFIEGSMVAAEVEQMLEMEEAEMAGVLQDERDLDDDVPEAGSYQHTDTELEDESSDLEDMSLGPGPSTGRRSMGRGGELRRGSGGRGAGRINLFSEGGSSMMGGNSFVGSSPAAARGPGLGNAFRNRLFRPSGPGR